MKRMQLLLAVALIFGSVVQNAQASSDLPSAERLGEKNWTEIPSMAHECELNKIKHSNRKVSSERRSGDRSVGRSGAVVAK